MVMMASELKWGTVILINDAIFKILSVNYHSGAGQQKGVVHVKMKNLFTASITEKRFRVEERLQQVFLDRIPMQFLYTDPNSFYFMNNETYEQVPVNKAIAPHLEPFLSPDAELQVEFYEGKPVNVIFPDSVELKVTSTPPNFDSDGDVYKSAMLENKIEVLVPQFISTGDTIKIDVATKKYMERIKKSK